MAQRSLQPVKQPGEYFNDVGNAAPSWFVAYAGFYLMTFVESVGNLPFSDIPPAPGEILARSLLGALGGAVLNAAFFGVLWFWLGSKLVQGKASLVATTKACGYAFLPPSILGLLTVPLMLWLASAGAESNLPAMLGTIAVELVAGLWALGAALVAIKRLNGFGVGKTLVVAAWLPGLVVVTVLIFFVISRT